MVMDAQRQLSQQSNSPPGTKGNSGQYSRACCSSGRFRLEPMCGLLLPSSNQVASGVGIRRRLSFLRSDAGYGFGHCPFAVSVFGYFWIFFFRNLWQQLFWGRPGDSETDVGLFARRSDNPAARAENKGNLER